MTAIGIGLVTLGCLFGFALFGIAVHPLLPEVHRGKDTRRTVKLGIGMVITVTSLVLSLLTFSVKNNFDATETNVRAYATSIILLDHVLRAYGPPADRSREMLRDYVNRALRTTWPEEFGRPERKAPELDDVALGQTLFAIQDMVRRFEPGDDYHREVATECLSHVANVIRQRLTLIEQVRRSIPPLLLWGVISWLAIIFLSFGLNAPRNPVVLGTMALCALAIASSIYFVDDMDTPFDGIIKISSQPLRDALAAMQR